MWMLLLRWSLGVAAQEGRMCLPVLWAWNGTVALLSVMGRVPTWIAGMRLPVLRILAQGSGSAACVERRAHLEDLNALAFCAGLELDYGPAVYVEIGVRLGHLYVLASSADLVALASSHVADAEMVVSPDML
jgi:hypothetical protein